MRSIYSLWAYTVSLKNRLFVKSAKPVIEIPVGLPCLERVHRSVEKNVQHQNMATTGVNCLPFSFNLFIYSSSERERERIMQGLELLGNRHVRTYIIESRPVAATYSYVHLLEVVVVVVHKAYATGSHTIN